MSCMDKFYGPYVSFFGPWGLQLWLHGKGQLILHLILSSEGKKKNVVERERWLTVFGWTVPLNNIKLTSAHIFQKFGVGKIILCFERSLCIYLIKKSIVKNVLQYNEDTIFRIFWWIESRIENRNHFRCKTLYGHKR